MKKILIVEDDHTLREAYELILKMNGYEVTAAPNGARAVEIVKKNFFDVILLDLLMPELDGVGFLEKSGVRKKSPKTKVIVFSNLSSSEKLKQALEIGVDMQLVKSDLSPKQLIETLESLSIKT